MKILWVFFCCFDPEPHLGYRPREDEAFEEAFCWVHAVFKGVLTHSHIGSVNHKEKAILVPWSSYNPMMSYAHRSFEGFLKLLRYTVYKQYQPTVCQPWQSSRLIHTALLQALAQLQRRRPENQFGDTDSQLCLERFEQTWSPQNIPKAGRTPFRHPFFFRERNSLYSKGYAKMTLRVVWAKKGPGTLHKKRIKVKVKMNKTVNSRVFRLSFWPIASKLGRGIGSTNWRILTELCVVKQCVEGAI